MASIQEPLLYAVYPGSVTLYNGTVRTFTALELATAYGVQAEPYLTVNNGLQVPQGEDYFRYIHLKPRQDDIYQNIKTTAQDDDSDVTWGPDFDGDRNYTQETNRENRDVFD
jgi:hypothetical protein